MSETPNLQLKYKIIVKDKDGKTIKEYERDARSFVKNFLTALYGSLIEQYISLVDVNGNTISNTGIIGTWSDWCNYGPWCNGGSMTVRSLGILLLNAPEGDDTYGIVVGTGTTPVTPDDYKLEQQIPHGSSDNQLYYQKTSIGAPNVSNGKVKISISRVFRNDGSVDVNINEIGLQAEVMDSSGATYKVLIVRDVLPQAEVVPGGGVLIVTYSIIA